MLLDCVHSSPPQQSSAVTDGLSIPAKLEASHDVSNFDCGAEELATWLKRFAFVNSQSGNARVFVTCRDRRVVGYYAIATSGTEPVNVSDSLKKGSVPSMVPCVLLARLAVNLSEQGCGIGRSLVADAVKRAVTVSVNVGVRLLLIHCRDDAAKAWYLSLAEFKPSPTDPMHLHLLMKQARHAFSDA